MHTVSSTALSPELRRLHLRRQRALVLAPPLVSATLARRAKSVDVSIVATLHDRERVDASLETEGSVVLLASLAAGFLSHELLHLCDERGIRCIGVYATRAERGRSSYLQLTDLVWHLAPADTFRKLLNN